MSVPFNAVMQHLTMETKGKYATYNNVLWTGCRYADNCYMMKYGIGVWTPNQKIAIWKGFFKDYLVRNGVPTACATKASSISGKMYKLYCAR